MSEGHGQETMSEQVSERGPERKFARGLLTTSFAFRFLWKLLSSSFLFELS